MVSKASSEHLPCPTSIAGAVRRASRCQDCGSEPDHPVGPGDRAGRSPVASDVARIEITSREDADKVARITCRKNGGPSSKTKLQKSCLHPRTCGQSLVHLSAST